jgi:hypothetical protein
MVEQNLQSIPIASCTYKSTISSMADARLSFLFSRKSAVSADSQIFRRDLATVFLLFVADLCALIERV